MISFDLYEIVWSLNESFSEMCFVSKNKKKKEM